jgi:hypothetical protein
MTIDNRYHPSLMQRRRRTARLFVRRTWICTVLAGVSLAVGCTSDDPPPAEATPPSEPEPATAVELDLWSGVPPLQTHPGDLTTAITPRPGPQKPATVAETIPLAFPPEVPPETGTPTVTTGPLTVERYGPVGAHELVDAIRVTFNQPMVPLASVESLATKTVPMTIDPAIEGKARWLGTRTVAFYPTGRLPFSTKYKVTVPAGATAESGKSLASPVTWEITTPVLALTSADPWAGSSGEPLDRRVTLTFNQPVQRASVVRALQWKGGGKTIAFTEVEPPNAATLEPWQRDRIVVLAPKDKLVPNTSYAITLPRGAWGEGPLPSEAITTTFSTYPPLGLSMSPCGTPCYAGNGISIASSTPIDDPRLESKVRVTPAVPNLAVSSWGSGIHLSGDFTGDMTYTVTVDPGIVDTFGQTLAKPFTGKQRLGPYYPELALASTIGTPIVIERGAARSLDLKIAGIDRLELDAASFELGDLRKYLDAYAYDGKWTWPSHLGAATWSKAFDVRSSRKRRETKPIDLTAAFGKRDMVWFTARGNEIKEYDWSWRPGLAQMAVVTDLGIAAAVDRDSGTFLVTRLSTGEPVAGATVVLGHDGNAKLWTGTTDAEGAVQASFATTTYPGKYLVSVEHDGDASFLRLDQNDLRGEWRYWGALEDSSLGFFFTDRAPYKPGETIHLVGILRQQTRGPAGATTWWRQNSTAKYKVVDPRGVDVASGDAKIGPFGTVAVDIETNPDGGTGYYQFTLEIQSLFGPTQTLSHAVAVETYRAPEFTARVERTDSKPLVFGDAIVAEIRGEYLHGAPLVGGVVDYTLTRTPASFRPPGAQNEAFTFGQGGSYGGWGWHGRGRHWGEGGYGGAPAITLDVKTGGALDARGKLIVRHTAAVEETPYSPPGAPKPAVAPPPATSESKPLPVAQTYSIAASVTDQNRQRIGASGSFVVHPALVYVGLRSERSVLRVSEQTNVEAIAVDLDGARVTGRPIAVDLLRKDTTRTPVEKDGRWQFEYATTEIRVGGCALVSDAAPQPCAVAPDKAGSYTARATTTDAAGHETRSEVTIYVQGDDEVIWDDSAERRVDLVADQRKYAPGDTAKILLRSPFTDARGIVVVEREGIAHEQTIVVKGGAHTIEVPITEAMTGGVSVSAVLTRGRVEIPGTPKGQDLGIPAAAVGQLDLDVVTDSKTIDVVLEPHAKEIAPKGSLALTITTKRKDTGAPLPAAVAVMVVDEGVLSLMDFKTPNPVAFFHSKRAPETWLHALQPNVLPRDPKSVIAALTPTPTSPTSGFMPAKDSSLGLGGFGRGGGGLAADEASAPRPSAAPPAPQAEAPSGMPAAADRRASREEKESSKKAEGNFDVATAMAQNVSLRTLFATTAFFDAEIETDAEGRAHVDIPMPENLTTFRIMAVAVDPAAADRFGSGESSVRVRKPVMIRPSLPRFANFGDTFEGSVMVDNQTGDAQKVLVGTRGLNVEYTGATETFVEIPAGESREVRFGMKVQQVGKMRLQFAAMSNGGRDATEVTLPVHYPATAKAFADYGMTDASIQHTLEPPADALPGFGGLELSFSSTALSGLQDAVSYLVDYPYECAEQTASRILPIFALGDVLDAFPIATVRDRALRDQLGRDGIAKLLAHQIYDGGFGYWRADESWPYLTNWVTFALLEGKRQGLAVDQSALDRALSYLENFISYGHRTRWGEYYDDTSRAFALWLLSGEKRGDALFDGVWNRRKSMPLYARVLLMSAAHRYGKTAEVDEIRRELRDAVVEGARTVHFAESKSEAASDGLRLLMHSSVQTDAIALVALLEIDPADTMLPKIMAGIMDDRDPRKGGRWLSTHANAWALVAASRYFTTIEKDEPDYTAQVWLDDLFAGEHQFRGRSMTKVDQTISMETIQGAPSRTLTLAKDGPGKLYYRMGLRYAPKDLKLKAVDNGFTVYRQYEALPGPDGKVDPDAVRQTEGGDWIVKAGTDVKVTINLVVSDRANYVVVDDPLPAGFEGLNPKFVTSVGALSESSSGGGGHRGGYDGWWWGWWFSFSHTDLRDDRMLLFADQLPAGVYTHSYSARATTIGDFLLPPVKAEEMYEPDRFGHGSSGRVTVVE